MIIAVKPGVKLKLSINDVLLTVNKTDYNLKFQDCSLFLLPLLQKTEALDELMVLQNDVVLTVVKKLIRFPFTIQMPYWCDLALDWLGSQHFKAMNSVLIDLQTSWMTQPLKHKFQKVNNILVRRQ